MRLGTTIVVFALLGGCERIEDVEREPVPRDPHPEPIEARGYMGIRYVMEDGVTRVDGVLPDSPAERAGLRAGDHILRYDDVRPASAAELQDLVSHSRPWRMARVVVERAGETRVVPVLLEQWPRDGREARALLR